MKKKYNKKEKAKISKRRYYPKKRQNNKSSVISEKEKFYRIKKNIGELDKSEFVDSSFDKIFNLIENLNALSLAEKILLKIKNTDDNYKDDTTNKKKNCNEDYPNKNLYKGKKEKELEIENNSDISNKVYIVEDSVKNNTPYKIQYEECVYSYEGKNPIKMQKITYHCKNYRKKKFA